MCSSPPHQAWRQDLKEIDLANKSWKDRKTREKQRERARERVMFILCFYHPSVIWEFSAISTSVIFYLFSKLSLEFVSESYIICKVWNFCFCRCCHVAWVSVILKRSYVFNKFEMKAICHWKVVIFCTFSLETIKNALDKVSKRKEILQFRISSSQLDNSLSVPSSFTTCQRNFVPARFLAITLSFWDDYEEKIKDWKWKVEVLKLPFYLPRFNWITQFENNCDPRCYDDAHNPRMGFERAACSKANDDLCRDNLRLLRRMSDDSATRRRYSRMEQFISARIKTKA